MARLTSDSRFETLNGTVMGPITEREIDTELEKLFAGGNDRDWIVTVFNNDKNTYEEVIDILREATGCTVEEAYNEAWEIDHLGKSIVHAADEETCVTVAKVIAKIGIKVEATLAWN